MAGLRKAKMRQTRDRRRKAAEAEALREREGSLRRAAKEIVGTIIILQDTNAEIDGLMAGLEAEFKRLPDAEKDEEAPRFLERLSALKGERKRISGRISAQLDAVMEATAKLDELTGISEADLRLIERAEGR